MSEPIRGDALLRAINEVVTAWAEEQGVVIQHDGVLVTVEERVDILGGMELLIRYPFVVAGAR